MSDTPVTSGEAFDAVLLVRRKILIVHWVLGLLSAFSFWTRSETPHPIMLSRGGVVIFLISALGWLPYLISWFYARFALEGNVRGTLGFILGAVLLTAVAVVMQHSSEVQRAPLQILISIGLTLLLIIVAKVSAIFWPVTWLD